MNESIDYKKRNAELVAMLQALLDGRVHLSIMLHRHWIQFLITANTEQETQENYFPTKKQSKINNSMVVKG
jgi:hypothetical protein